MAARENSTVISGLEVRGVWPNRSGVGHYCATPWVMPAKMHKWDDIRWRFLYIGSRAGLRSKHT